MKSHVEKNLNKIKEKIFTIETIIQILIVIFRFFLFLNKKIKSKPLKDIFKNK